jgi:hypothetical protein
MYDHVEAFKDRYFSSRPFSRSPTSLHPPSPTPDDPSSRPFTPPSSFRYPSPLPVTEPGCKRGGSSLSVDTFRSGGTVRPQADGVLRLTHGDTPELFQAQLECVVIYWTRSLAKYGFIGGYIPAKGSGMLLNGSVRKTTFI